MNVLDASVITDALAAVGPAGDQAREVLAREPLLHVPAIMTVEVTSALRSRVRRGVLDAHVAGLAAERAVSLRTRDDTFAPLLARVWELRDAVTAYDAWWVALAEALKADLVTADERLRRASGPRCRVLSPEQALVQT